MPDSRYLVVCYYLQAVEPNYLRTREYQRVRSDLRLVEYREPPVRYEQDKVGYYFTLIAWECVTDDGRTFLLQEAFDHIVDRLCEKWPHFDLNYCTWWVVPPCRCAGNSHIPYNPMCSRTTLYESHPELLLY